MKDHELLEKKIKDKGLNEPRLIEKQIRDLIENCEYYVFPSSSMTVCCLTLQNGFVITGESACVSPENFDKELGEEISKKKAVEKIWMLEGYLLKEKIYRKKGICEECGLVAFTKTGSYCKTCGRINNN